MPMTFLIAVTYERGNAIAETSPARETRPNLQNPKGILYVPHYTANYRLLQLTARKLRLFSPSPSTPTNPARRPASLSNEPVLPSRLAFGLVRPKDAAFNRFHPQGPAPFVRPWSRRTPVTSSPSLQLNSTSPVATRNRIPAPPFHGLVGGTLEAKLHLRRLLLLRALLPRSLTHLWNPPRLGTTPWGSPSFIPRGRRRVHVGSVTSHVAAGVGNGHLCHVLVSFLGYGARDSGGSL